MSLTKEEDIAHMAGWLYKRRRVLGVKKLRYFKLSGQVLSSHPNRCSEASWEQNVLHADIKGVLQQKRIDIISCDRTTTMYAETDLEYHNWLSCLCRNANRVIQDRYCFRKEVLGTGSFGKVLLAEDRNSEELVAVKTIEKEGPHDDEHKIWREISVMRSLKHKNIVATRSVYETQSKLYIVMDYMSGGSLGRLFRETGSLEEDAVRMIMKDILAGVAYLHEMKIAHRDLKLTNILCAENKLPCAVKIGDFGLANFAEGNHILRSRVGSPHYVAPEILEGDPYGVSVDCWAVGVIMHILLTGKYPFAAKNIRVTLENVVSSKVRIHGRIWEGISYNAKNLVSRLLERSVSKRISAREALNHPWFE